MSKITPDEAIAKLLAGEVVALPTETVYGLAGRHDKPEAVESIFKTKKRPSFDPLILHVKDLEQATELVQQISPAHKVLADAFWPGPLTLIFDKSEKVSYEVTSGLETVAVRAPKHPLFLQILEKIGKALAAPSANQFSKTSPTTAEHVESEFSGVIDVVDGGACESGIESTILQLKTAEQSVQVSVLRPGVIAPAIIRSKLEEAGLKVEFVASQTMAPGKMKAHYQPAQPLILFDSNQYEAKDIEAKSSTLRSKGESHELDKSKLDFSKPGVLTLSADPAIAARELYAELRRLSAEDHTILLCPWPHGPKPPESWLGIFDRLNRASHTQFF
ncbi:MAG: threonylcarbamoyl-AMP synthase [Bdellovibrionales bacterium]|nr:threonylcarbamoyl-AMP synthase [Bdellovibrionales bacterium]